MAQVTCAQVTPRGDLLRFCVGIPWQIPTWVVVLSPMVSKTLSPIEQFRDHPRARAAEPWQREAIEAMQLDDRCAPTLETYLALLTALQSCASLSAKHTDVAVR